MKDYLLSMHDIRAHQLTGLLTLAVHETLRSIKNNDGKLLIYTVLYSLSNIITIEVVDLVIEELGLLGGAILLKVCGNGIFLFRRLLLHWKRNVLKAHTN